MDLIKLYNELLELHGPQGWWPLNSEYHPGDYSYPKNGRQRFEICAGAILTQNTAWRNVEKALDNLRRLDALNPEAVLKMGIDDLAQAARPAGYFNQKARKLKEFAEFFRKLKGVPTREQLLEIWGIGPETADSILLYAYNLPSFVVDAYTKRVIGVDKSYDEIKEMFENSLERDYRLYQEFHALIVAHAKSL